MDNRIPRILMLGWEFPPVINGGLGIACHDLCNAMTAFAEISVILPKASKEFLTKRLNLIGLNNIDANALGHIHSYNYYYGAVDMNYVEADLDPYYSETIQVSSEKQESETRSRNEPLNYFGIQELYGGNMAEKVLQFSRIAARLAVKKEFDVIHAHDWMTMVAGMEIKAQTGKPLVVHVHSTEIDRSGERSRGWVYETEKAGMEYADLIIPVSNFTGRVIREHYGINENKIATVHNGISKVQAFKSGRAYKQKTVLFVGRLTRQKGPENFLEIAAQVLRYDPEVRFIMAGTGDYYKTLLEQSSCKHLGNRFHLTGFLQSEKLRYLLSLSDVYCMPSVSEPFGLSAVEAVQFGVPCVISKQSGVSEVLSGSLKFDFWDIHKAADHILNLLHDPVLAHKVASDANENLKSISWENAAHKVKEAYIRHNILAN